MHINPISTTGSQLNATPPSETANTFRRRTLGQRAPKKRSIASILTH